MSAPVQLAGCYVLTLPSRDYLLQQFLRRWNRATRQRDIEVFYAVEHPDPVRSCFESHLAMLRAAPGPVAIFEEDAVFSAAFTLDVRPPDLPEGPAAIAFLGGQHIHAPLPVPGDPTGQWVRPTRINRTHGYIALDPQRLAEGLGARTHHHVDDALDALQVPKIALARFTVGQAAGTSSINGRITRTHRFWND